MLTVLASYSRETPDILADIIVMVAPDILADIIVMETPDILADSIVPDISNIYNMIRKKGGN